MVTPPGPARKCKGFAPRTGCSRRGALQVATQRAAMVTVTACTATFRRLAAVLLVLPAVGCAARDYRPEPLEPARIAAGLAERRSNDGGLRAFMERHGASVSKWPLPRWDMTSLTPMAVYFHPDMEVARANLEVQRAAEITAGARPNPRGGPLLEHHTGPGTVDSPWSIGLGLDIPIELGGKREARIARARQLSEEARLAIAETAWRVRSRLSQRFVEVYGAESAAALSKQELEFRQQEVTLLDRFQKAGEASPSEVSLSHLKFQEARLAADAADGDIRSAQAGLAQALGLPFDQVLALPIGFDRLSGDTLPSMPDAGLQQAALQNRLDLQGGLARYAAAEAALREEIAKQYPDLDLSPGLLWDQGDWVKSLGAMILLPILNRNEGPIAEAEAKRKLEAARFKSLEADVFAQLTESRVRFDAAVTRWQTAKSLIATQTDRLASIKKSIEHGELDRLSLVESEIELLAAKRSELDARIAAHRAWSALEDAVQKPLDQSAPPPDGTAPATTGAGNPP